MKVAWMVGKSVEFDAEAEKLKARIIANAARHAKTGQFISSLGVEKIPGERGVKDRAVYSTDPGALAIEFGRHDEDGKFHMGQKNIQHAIAELSES